MNLKFEGNQVTSFFKLNQQYFFYSVKNQYLIILSSIAQIYQDFSVSISEVYLLLL